MNHWDIQRDPARARALRAQGTWGNQTLADYARALAAEDPGRVLIIDGTQRLTTHELVQQAEQLARVMLGLGLEPGDVVSYMLPNWYETAVISLAATMAGLVLNPLLPIYRERETAFMLADCSSRLLFIPAVFRGFDYRELVGRIRGQLPALRHFVVLRGEAGDDWAYEDLCAREHAASLPQVDADAVRMLIYTSGTTGRAKGVLHSHNTLLADVRSLTTFWQITPDDCFFVPSPVTHIGGSLYAHEFTCFLGTPAVLLDIWSVEGALTLMREFGCTVSAGATPFLRDLAECARRLEIELPDLRLYVCGGAEVPAQLVRAAREVFAGCIVTRAYGSTEVPTVTTGGPRCPDLATCADSDGVPCGTQVRIVHPETGAAVAEGAEGEVLVQGPEMLLGYTRREDNEQAFSADGFFRTGDLGRILEGERLVITGRKKDLIIRAGENISAKEIEDLLLRHPQIADVAVVAVPSARTGEAACACIVPRTAQVPTLADIGEFVIAAGVARQKIPEALVLFSELPRTATGKVRKDVLRQQAREHLAGESKRRPG